MSNLLSKDEIENRIAYLKDMKNGINSDEGSDNEIHINNCGSSKVGYVN